MLPTHSSATSSKGSSAISSVRIRPVATPVPNTPSDSASNAPMARAHLRLKPKSQRLSISSSQHHSNSPHGICSSVHHIITASSSQHLGTIVKSSHRHRIITSSHYSTTATQHHHHTSTSPSSHHYLLRAPHHNHRIITSSQHLTNPTGQQFGGRTHFEGERTMKAGKSVSKMLNAAAKLVWQVASSHEKVSGPPARFLRIFVSISTCA